jgi:hypothetical protein
MMSLLLVDARHSEQRRPRCVAYDFFDGVVWLESTVLKILLCLQYRLVERAITMALTIGTIAPFFIRTVVVCVLVLVARLAGVIFEHAQ